MFFCFLVPRMSHFISDLCLLPTSSLSPCAYLWPGMCRAGQRACAPLMCGCRRPPLRLQQQTSQIIIASPRSRCGAVTLNHGHGDERETVCVCRGRGKAVSVYLCGCLLLCSYTRVWSVLMAVQSAFEWVSWMSVTLRYHPETRPTRNQSSAVSQV